MATFLHLGTFALAAGVIWFFAGLLIDVVQTVAARIHRSNFGVAFVVLGILTSLSEISVAVNATIGKTPDISAGNLLGASLVIVLLIIPALAVLGGGIELRHTLSLRKLALAFGAIFLPALAILGGTVSRGEGLGMILAYVALVWLLRSAPMNGTFGHLEEAFHNRGRELFFDLAKLAAGAVAIFLAGHVLVEEAQYFAAFFGVPGSLIGLLALSLGTNVPEIVVAARSVLKQRKDIAFGDYIGSAAANTLIFGALAVANGPLTLGSREFVPTALILAAGLGALFVFSRSGRTIARHEGYILLVLYAAFFALQVGEAIGRGAS